MVLEHSKDKNGQWINNHKKPADYLTPDLISYSKYKINRNKPYIAAFINRDELQNYDGKFVIGTGQTFSTRLRRSINKEYEYINGPLFEETEYSVFQRAYTNEVCLNFRVQFQYNHYTKNEVFHYRFLL